MSENQPPSPTSHPPFEPELLRARLREMQTCSDRFYMYAVALEVHPFIEFCGLMNKYIELCHKAVDAGIDFRFASVHTGVALPVQEHDAAYLGEKFGCIFGPTLENQAVRQAFLEQAFGPEPAPAASAEGEETPAQSLDRFFKALEGT